MARQVICLGTNYLIFGPVADSRERVELRAWVTAGETLVTPMSVWHEFLSGPVPDAQRDTIRSFVHTRIPFDEAQAQAHRTADLVKTSGSRRSMLTARAGTRFTRKPMFIRSQVPALLFSLMAVASGASAQLPAQHPFWSARDTVITRVGGTAKVKIGIWDSGVDTTLFQDKLARDPSGKPLLRGYDPHKRRQDSFLALLDAELLARRDSLNAALQAVDDMESGVKSARAAALTARLDSMTEAQLAAFDAALGLWSGYTHGTAVADIAVAGNAQAEIITARMEWWHGDPPVPCWSRELADREAASIADLLQFLASSGARVVNLSWNRARSSYLGNLNACANHLPIAEREALAQYTVDTIRSVLQRGMSAHANVLFVGAAGNAGAALSEADQATRFALPNFILVGALDQQGQRARFANTGPEVTLHANGERVPARLPGGPVSYPSGTSMAAPNVANAAAKMLAVNPALTAVEVRELLEQTAERNATGERMLNVMRAVAAAKSRRR